MDPQPYYPGQRVLRSAFSGARQVINTAHGRWRGTVQLALQDDAGEEVAERVEAFFSSLESEENWTRLPLNRPSTPPAYYGYTNAASSKVADRLITSQVDASSVTVRVDTGQWVRASPNLVGRPVAIGDLYEEEPVKTFWRQPTTGYPPCTHHDENFTFVAGPAGTVLGPRFGSGRKFRCYGHFTGSSQLLFGNFANRTLRISGWVRATANGNTTALSIGGCFSNADYSSYTCPYIKRTTSGGDWRIWKFLNGTITAPNYATNFRPQISHKINNQYAGTDTSFEFADITVADSSVIDSSGKVGLKERVFNVRHSNRINSDLVLDPQVVIPYRYGISRADYILAASDGPLRTALRRDRDFWGPWTWNWVEVGNF